MATFQERVEDYIGSISDTTPLNDWVTEEARRALFMIDKAFLHDYAARIYSTSSAGESSVNKVILSVSRNGYRARKVDAADRAKVADSNSLFFATSSTPVYYLQTTATDTRLFVLPAPTVAERADIAYVPVPTSVAASASTIDNYPLDGYNLVALGVARRVLQKRLDDAVRDEDIEQAGTIRQDIANISSLYAEQLQMLSMGKADLVKLGEGSET